MEGEEDEEEGDDWEYEEVEEEPEVPRREVLIDFLKSLSHSFVFRCLLQKLAGSKKKLKPPKRRS